MKSISKLAGAIAVVFASVMPAQEARADYVNLGNLNPGTMVTLFESHSGNGSMFADTFGFSVSADASLASVLGSVRFGSFTGITEFTSSLWQTGGLNPLANGTTTTVDGPFGTSIASSSISYSPLIAGLSANYEIRTSGTILGIAGTYAGLVNISPIPEPAIFALLIAGLSLLGLFARRQKGQARHAESTRP